MEAGTNKDNITIIISIVLLFSFIGFLFYDSYKRDKINLIREDLIHDSIIMLEHNKIKKQDSILKINDSILEKKFHNHEKQLYRLERKIEKLEEAK